MSLRVGRRVLAVTISVWLVWPGSGQAKQSLRDEPICTAPLSQVRPRVVADERGGAIVAWQDFRERPANYAHRLGASGKVDPEWPIDGLSLSNGVDNQADARLVSDGARGAIIAWQVVGGSERDHIIYVQHLLPSGAFDPAWPVGGRPLAAPPGHQFDPVMVPDGEGGAILAWVDYRNGRQDIYAQHVLATGVVDPAWPRDGVPVCTAPGVQALLRIVTDGAGGAIVAWVDAQGEEDIYAQRVLSSGMVDPAWPVDGRALCTAPYVQVDPVLVEDGSGGAIVAWTDTRSTPGHTYAGYYDIYAQHVLASGEVNPAWPYNGLAVCALTGDQRFPTIVSDGAGGAFLSWGDDRPSGRGNYAQHLVSTGIDPAWPPNGLVVCNTAAGRTVMAADGSGGALIAWGDGRDGNVDVYAHHLTAWGADPDWPANGRAVYAGPGDQGEVAIAADRHGRAFVAWRDSRNGNADIYATRLDRPTPVQPPRPGRHAELRVHAPMRGQAASDVSIAFELPEPQSVSITVFDVTGRAVRTITEGHELPAGAHVLTWDGADDAGAKLKRGVYLVRLRSASGSVIRKHSVLQ